MFWCGTHALLQRAVAGDAEALEPLEAMLASAPAELLRRLPHAPRDAQQHAVVSGAGEHRGQRLEPLGRRVVLALADTLDLSELACWDHLLAASTAGELEQPAPGSAAAAAAEVDDGVPAAEAMAERASALYLRERRCMLLLLLDCLKLSSTAAASSLGGGDDDESGAARTYELAAEAAARFIASVQRVPVPGAAAGGALSLTLLSAAEGLARACASGAAAAYGAADAPAGPFGAPGGGFASSDGPAQAVRLERRRSELLLLCRCLFFRCLAPDRPPANEAAALAEKARLLAALMPGSIEVPPPCVAAVPLQGDRTTHDMHPHCAHGLSIYLSICIYIYIYMYIHQ